MEIELSDAQLVRRIGAGEREAEAELFHRMAPRIRLYGLRHLRDVQASEDLTQNVLITIIEALRQGPGNSAQGNPPAARLHGGNRMNRKDESQPEKCSNPIDVTVLVDYWIAALEGSGEEAVEEHLFACDECGERLRELIALADG